MSSRVDDTPLVSVCLCTYRRTHLAETLRSLFAQTGIGPSEMEIIVVDNDRSRFGERIVADAGGPVRYLVEPRKGISAARNKSILAARGRWLAFIDDDEVAAPDWIVELLGAADAFEADAVMGLVASAVPADAPWWAKSGIFDRPMPPRGSIVAVGRCGNALLRTSLQRSLGITFADEFGASGGEDFQFFRALQNHGARMVSCPEAVVTEVVPPERLLVGYHVHRAILAAESYARILFPRPSPVVAVLNTGTALVKLVAFGLVALACVPLAAKTSVRLGLRSVEQLGKVRHFLGLRPLDRR